MRNKILLSLILLLSTALRLWQLDQLPSILNRDEAALAYNAKLLLEAGRDEWGQAWPLTFKSFGDYKLPGYIYTLTALFHFLPQQDWVVRLPSALAGVLLVVVVALFARRILQLSTRAALFAALSVAVLPIFSFYSRIAFEANVALTLLVTALYLLFKDKPRDLCASVLLLGAIATYNTPLLLLPFLLPLLIWWRGWRRLRRWLPVVLMLLLIGTAAAWILAGLQSQKSGITIFSDQTLWQEFAAVRADLSGWQQKVLGNQYVFYLQLIWERLWASLSPEFLLTRGGNHPWHSLPGFGHVFYLLYLLAAAMLIDIGGEIFFALRERRLTTQLRHHLLLLYLLIIGLAPSVVTVDSPHATRSLLFFVAVVLLAATFADRLLSVFKKHVTAILFALLLILLCEAGNYFYTYFVQYPQQQPAVTWPAFKSQLRQLEADHPAIPIAVVDPEGYHYIVAAWYLQLSSLDFFASIKHQAADHIGLHYGEQVGRYRFIAHPADRRSEERLLLSPQAGILEF